MMRFWSNLSSVHTVLLTIAIGMFCLGLSRLMAAARRLRGAQGDLQPEQFLLGTVDPEVFGEDALRHKDPPDSLLASWFEPGTTLDQEARRRVAFAVTAAHARFHKVSACFHADLAAAKRLSMQVLLVSLVSAGVSIYPAWSRVEPGHHLRIDVVDELMAFFSLGVALCLFLSIVSSYLERQFELRSAFWEYFFARLRAKFLP